MSRQISTIKLAEFQLSRGFGDDGKLSTLCTHANINKYARYKPVRSSKLSLLTDDELEAANYGLSISGVTIFQRAADLTGTISPWSIAYNKPDGVNYPFRLSDFIEYSPSAEFIIRTITAESITVYSDNLATIRFTNTENYSGSVPVSAYVNNNITFLSLYLGFFAVNTSGQFMLFAEDGHIASDGSISLNQFRDVILPADAVGKSWTFYVIIANEALHGTSAKTVLAGSALSSKSGYKVIPFPESNGLIRFVAGADFAVTCEARRGLAESGRYPINIEATITNNTASALSVTCSWVIRRDGSTSTLYSGSISVPTISAKASTTVSTIANVTSVIYNAIPTTAYNVVVTVTGNDKTITTQSQIIA